MLTRLVEDWLTNANERMFELPFCHMLQGEGYSVIHLSRHGEWEQGKDVLAIDPDGIPCAFQLKGTDSSGKMRLREWQQYKPQIDRLVELPITHPSVTESSPRRAVLVVNGQLDEPVRQEIADRNREYERRGFPKLETIVRGQLLQRIQAVQSDFWPTEPHDVKLLLELSLTNGQGLLRKDDLWRLLNRELPYQAEALSDLDFRRAVSSAGIFCAYAIAPFAHANNHIAVMEGLAVFLGACLSLAERHGIARRHWEPYVDTTRTILDDAYVELYRASLLHSHFVPSSAIPDVVFPIFHRARTTTVISMLSAWDLSLRSRNLATTQYLPRLVQDQMQYCTILSEADIPQILAILWHTRRTQGRPVFDAHCQSLLQMICFLNHPSRSGGLPDPYHDKSEVIDKLLPGVEGIEEYLRAALRSQHETQTPSAASESTKGELNSLEFGKLLKTPDWGEDFTGSSYMIEPLLLLYVRRNWKQSMRMLWPDISRLVWCWHRVDEPWLFYWLDAGDKGELQMEQPQLTMSWETLREKARAPRLEKIPSLLRECPDILLLLVLVAPYRFTPDVALFLDDWVSGLPHGQIVGKAPLLQDEEEVFSQGRESRQAQL